MNVEEFVTVVKAVGMSSVRRMEAAAMGASRALGGMATAAAAAAAGAGLLGIAAAREAARIGGFADSFDLTTESAGRLLGAFQQVGIDGNDATDVLATLTDRARDAADGMQSMADDFGLIGISADELRGKRPDELLELVSKRAREVGDAGTVATFAVRTFGDDLGRRLLPQLNGSAEGLDELMERASAFSLIVDKETRDSARALGQNLTLLTMAARTFAHRLGVPFIRPLEEATDRLVEFAAVTGRAVGERLQDGVQSLVDGFGRLSPEVRGLLGLLAAAGGVRLIGMFASNIESMVSSMGPLGAKLIEVTGGFRGLLGVVSRIVLPALLVVAALDDLAGFARGDDSIIGRVLRALGGEEAEEGGRRALLATIELLKQVSETLSTLAEIAFDEIKAGLISAAEGMRDFAASIGFSDKLEDLIDALERLDIPSLSDIADSIEGAGQGFEQLNRALGGTPEERAVGLDVLGQSLFDTFLAGPEPPPGFGLPMPARSTQVTTIVNGAGLSQRELEESASRINARTARELEAEADAVRGGP